MSRRIARENTFKLVFEYLFLGEANEVTLENALQSTDENDKTYISSLYKAILENSETIKELITKYSHEFSFDRIFKIDLAILHIAVAEILYMDIPYQVSVNEALEISKRYSTEKSSSFINGVLSGIISELNISQ